jgi:hypothetical protein
VSIINGVPHRETHLVEDVSAEQFRVSRGLIRDALRHACLDATAAAADSPTTG